MRSRRLLALLLVSGLLLTCSHPPQDTRPDLLLVVVDTLRADHLSTYGYARGTSPGLDALAQTGVVFEDNTSQSSWTLPSVASLHVGRHLFVNAWRLPDSVKSLAERLRDAGYQTAAFIGNPALSASGGYNRGFQDFIGRETTGNVTWNAADLKAAVLRWLQSHPRDGRPRFLYLHYMDPHFPYEPKDPPPVSGEVVLRDDTLAAWVTAVKAAGPGTPLYDKFNDDRLYVLQQIDAYDHEIANMDRSLSELLHSPALVPQAPGAPAPLVVVAADHGEGLWDHRHHDKVVADKVPVAADRTLREVFFRDHSYHLWQELLHTPLIVAGPGFPAGKRIATPVENVDIVPTLLRAAGLPPDPELEGRALQDVVTGTGRPRPVLYAFCKEGTAVREVADGWKFIFPTPTGDSYAMPMQLYDLAHDPHERDNRATDPAQREILKRLLKLREDAAAAFHLYDNESTESDAPEQNAVLKELGYVGEGGSKPKKATDDDEAR